MAWNEHSVFYSSVSNAHKKVLKMIDRIYIVLRIYRIWGVQLTQGCLLYSE